MARRYTNDQEPLPQREPFLWTTNEGVKLEVTSMETRHIYHSLRMLWNHTVEPRALKLLPYAVRAGVANWPADYRREAFDAFMAELPRRVLEPQWAADLIHITRERRAMESALKRLSAEEWDAVGGDPHDGDDWDDDPFQDSWLFT